MRRFWSVLGVLAGLLAGPAQAQRDTTTFLGLFAPRVNPSAPSEFVPVTPNFQAALGLPGLWVTGPFVLGTAGTRLTRVQVFSQTITPALVGATTQAEQSFTVTGLVAGDKVIVNPSANVVNGVFLTGCRVSAANTLACTYDNTTAGGLTPTAGTWTIVAIQ